MGGGNGKERWKEKSRAFDQKNGGVFGIHLSETLKYASVAVSIFNSEDGKSYIYGYIPIVVAKCALFLKENATETEGVFGVSGSAKRMKELQAIFDAPPKYGMDLQWSNYSVHDAAGVLRRFLNMMPEPVVPYDLYHSFRDCLTYPGQSLDDKIQHFRLLLLSVPPSSQCLLLYVLDFLLVFSRNSCVNLMTASNLAVLFQPGLVRPPEADLTNLGESTAQGIKALAEAEANGHKSSQEILKFLIEHQDHFLLGLGPPPKVSFSPASANATAVASQSSIPQPQLQQPALVLLITPVRFKHGTPIHISILPSFLARLPPSIHTLRITFVSLPLTMSFYYGQYSPKSSYFSLECLDNAVESDGAANLRITLEEQITVTFGDTKHLAFPHVSPSICTFRLSNNRSQAIFNPIARYSKLERRFVSISEWEGSTIPSTHLGTIVQLSLSPTQTLGINPCPIAQLPTEIISIIFESLLFDPNGRLIKGSLVSVRRLSAVCRLWKALSVPYLNEDVSVKERHARLKAYPNAGPLTWRKTSSQARRMLRACGWKQCGMKRRRRVCCMRLKA
ncbi:RhoGAP-domain-containing protein [Atractiella rhizophila]|nr:RhoGAP-domain-containing protein [Atractiella rhizophila]